MAGFMTKLQGYVYEGELVNGAGAAVKNGILMVLGTGDNKGKLVLPSANDSTTKLLLKETTDVDGLTGYRFVVDKLNNNYYFVENNFDVNDSEEYDIATATIAAGALLRAHPLVPGEEFVTTMITGTLTVGTEYGVKTTGNIG